ncbi:hypothetical protein AFLA_000798 [Aspergillus flavus NRRL3357]|nr:hypothetical protein AFLA_000798 [Aspergillus flavus NRRL3357]
MSSRRIVSYITPRFSQGIPGTFSLSSRGKVTHNASRTSEFKNDTVQSLSFNIEPNDDLTVHASTGTALGIMARSLWRVDNLLSLPTPFCCSLYGRNFCQFTRPSTPHYQAHDPVSIHLKCTDNISSHRDAYYKDTFFVDGE